MKTRYCIICICLIALLNATGSLFAEISIQIISPVDGDRFEACQDITIEVDVQTTEGEEIDRVWYYNHGSLPLGSSRSTPYSFQIKYILTSGCYSITAVLELKNGTTDTSEVVSFTVGDAAPGECLQNSTFECDVTKPWALTNYSPAKSSLHILNDDRFGGGPYIMVDIENGGSSNLSIYLGQPVDIQKPHVYKISFWAQASQERGIGVSVGPLRLTGGAVQHFNQTVQIDTQPKQYTFVFEPSKEGVTDNSFCFWMAMHDSSIVYLSNISLIDTTAAHAIIQSSVQPSETQMISNYELLPAYPNPFNPSTNIEFVLPKSEHVELKIYNGIGQEMATLVSGNLPQGHHRFNWDASGLGSGVYLYHMQTPSFVQTKRVVYMP